MREETLICEIEELMREEGFKVNEVTYPSTRKRALDLICEQKGTLVIMKICRDIDKMEKEEANVLKALSASLKSQMFIVGLESKKGSLEDDVVYERHGVPAVSPQTLRELVRGSNIYIYSGRGGYYVKIDGKKLRAFRESRGMSIGDLASLLGVSRKAVYEYERGVMAASIRTATKLVKLFGEEVLKPVRIDISSYNEITYPDPDIKIEEELIYIMIKKGFLTAHIKYSPIDIAGSLKDSKQRVVFAIKHKKREKNLILKIEDLLRLIDVLKAEVYAIVKDSSEAKSIGDLGLKVLCEGEAKHLVSNMGIKNYTNKST